MHDVVMFGHLKLQKVQLITAITVYFDPGENTQHAI